MKYTLLSLALALTPLSLSADVVFKKHKNVDREIVVTLIETTNFESEVIGKIVEAERNRWLCY